MKRFFFIDSTCVLSKRWIYLLWEKMLAKSRKKIFPFKHSYDEYVQCRVHYAACTLHSATDKSTNKCSNGITTG